MGQELDWAAEDVPVVLFVELPFWLMVPDCSLAVVVNDHEYTVEVRSWLYALYVREVTSSQLTCVYIGPENGSLDPELRKQIDGEGIPTLRRKCKTVLRIHSKCNSDVLRAAEYGSSRSRVAQWYLRALCEAHIVVVNNLIRSYRQTTYDYFPHEISPWDIPVWFVEQERNFTRVGLLPYADWDYKPHVGPSEGQPDVYKLTEPAALQSAISAEASAAELELLDAINLMERGDYSSAVRRITTAIEAVLETALRGELQQRHSESEVVKRLRASRNDFPGRLRQYEKLSGRTLPETLSRELEATRRIRHTIVHEGNRISYAERGRAQRSVDTGRWTFNWLENQPEQAERRETRLALRSLGRHFTLYNAEITPDGAVVHKPSLGEDE